MYRVIPVIHNTENKTSGHVLDTSELCRTCGVKQQSTSDPFISIFDESSDGQTLNNFLLKLFALFQIDIRENDGLPQKVCTTCFQTFDAINEFHKKCERIQEILAILQNDSVKPTKSEASDAYTDGIPARLNFEEFFVNSGNLENMIIEGIEEGTTEIPVDTELYETECINFEVKAVEEYNKNIESLVEEVLNEVEGTPIDPAAETTNKSEQPTKEETKNADEKNESSDDSLSSIEIETLPKRRPRRNSQPSKLKGIKYKLLRNKECRFCKKLFSNHLNHERCCKLRNIEICYYCSMEFPTDEELQHHITEKHPKRKPACSTCWISFENFSQRKDHLIVNHNDDKYVCTICNYDYRSIYNLKKHNETFHAEIINRPCPICGLICSTERKYDYHVKTHNSENKKFVCNICGRRFMQINHLDQHKTTHSNERAHLCNVCGQGFKIAQSLRNHMINSHGIVSEIKNRGPNYGKFQLNRADNASKKICDDCGRLFATSGALRTHKLHVHKMGQRVKCRKTDCPEEFTARWTLIKHMKEQHNICYDEQFLFSCDTCPKRFKTAAGLDLHMKFHSDKDRPHRCHICDYTFKRREHLRLHIKRLHTLEKNFECSHCDRKFLERFELNDHMRIHTKEKPFKCTICFKDFRYLSAFRLHRRVHTGEKSHVCQICQKSFTTRVTLNSHFNKHTVAEKKFLEELILEAAKDSNET